MPYQGRQHGLCAENEEQSLLKAIAAAQAASRAGEFVERRLQFALGVKIA
jgi:hypothetical protein